VAKRGRKKRWLKKKDRQTVGFILGIILLIGVCYQPIVAAAAPTSTPVANPSKLDAVLSLASEQVGTKESPAGSNKQKYGADYGANGVAWCAEFVWWVFDRAAAGGAMPNKTASVYTLRDEFVAKGWFDMQPRPGDVVIYNYGQGHTGIIKSVQDKTITAIEGNTSASNKGDQSDGGMVAEKTRPRDSHILGYGHPNWDVFKLQFKSLSSPYNDLFEQKGKQYGVNPLLLAGMAKQESGFNPQAGSKAGAKGLMQFTDVTAKSYKIDPWKPDEAIDGAARFMANSLKAYNGNADMALASYNAGGAAVKKFGGVPPYAETQNYVKSINAMVAAAS
jgi:hypothetical protein